MSEHPGNDRRRFTSLSTQNPGGTVAAGCPTEIYQGLRTALREEPGAFTGGRKK